MKILGLHDRLVIFSDSLRVIFYLHLHPLAGLCMRVLFMAPCRRSNEIEFVEDVSGRLRTVDLCNINYSLLVFSSLMDCWTYCWWWGCLMVYTIVVVEFMYLSSKMCRFQSELSRVARWHLPNCTTFQQKQRNISKCTAIHYTVKFAQIVKIL